MTIGTLPILVQAKGRFGRCSSATLTHLLSFLSSLMKLSPRVWSKHLNCARLIVGVTSTSNPPIMFLVFVVRQSIEPGWLYGELRGKTGLIPENYVEDLPDGS